MKRLRIVLIVVIILLCVALPVRASEVEIYAKSGSDALIEALPEETRRLLTASGVSPQEVGTDAVSSLLAALSEQVRDELTAPLRVLVLLIAAAVLSRLVLEFAPAELQSTVDLCSALCAAVLLLPQIQSLLERTADTAQALGTFLLAAVPVYTGMFVLSGNTAAGTSYGALTLMAANGITALSGQIFLPVTRVFLALSAVSSVTEYDLKKLMDALYKCMKWVLTLAVSVFTGVLSLQTIISAQTDAVTGKAVKMITSSAIPIVGGAFGDALSILSASVGTVKSGIGAFGVLAAAVVFLPLCLKISVWITALEAAGFAAELFSMRGFGVFLSGCVTALKLLLAILFSMGAAAVIAAAVLLCVRGTYG